MGVPDDDDDDEQVMGGSWGDIANHGESLHYLQLTTLTHPAC